MKRTYPVNMFRVESWYSIQQTGQLWMCPQVACLVRAAAPHFPAVCLRLPAHELDPIEKETDLVEWV